MNSGSAFDRFIEHTDPTLVVVTTIADGVRAGCLVGFHSQASIEPQQYAVWLSRANHTCRVAMHAAWFAVHYLDETQLAVAEHFGTQSGDTLDKFASVDWRPSETGVPLLTACPNRLLLRLTTVFDTVDADHVCFLAAVDDVQFRAGPSSPLRLSDAHGLTAGHEADDTPQVI